MRFKIGSHLKNVPGWRTDRKIVVFDSDDWGGIRTPSREVYLSLKEQGIAVSSNEYQYDSLASREDLAALFSVLEGVTDSLGNHAVFTAVANVANPDFDRIRKADFKEYFYEKFTDTLKRYYPGDRTFEMWERGMASGIFVPELHGREHLAVQIWMDKLREGNRDLQRAFDMGVASVKLPGLHPAVSEFRPAFYFNAKSQVSYIRESIPDAVSLYREIFGRTPNAFVPSNEIFHQEFEEEVARAGMDFLNVGRMGSFPADKGSLKSRYYRTGSKNKFGTTYYIRNCAFEPASNGYSGTDPTLYQVKAAFAWGKPAFISTHRVNYIGAIDPANRIRGLGELEVLLKAIIRLWPDVEFMSSADALRSLRALNK